MRMVAAFGFVIWAVYVITYCPGKYEATISVGSRVCHRARTRWSTYTIIEPSYKEDLWRSLSSLLKIQVSAMFNLKRFNSPQEPFESSEDFRTETWKQDVKACFNRRFVFRLWQILVFLLIIAVIVTVLGVLAAMLGTRQQSSKPNSYRAAKAKETKKNGGNRFPMTLIRTLYLQ